MWCHWETPPFDPGWEWLMSPTIARCGEMIIESKGIIMASLTGRLALSRSSLAITWTAPVDFIFSCHLHTQQKPRTHGCAHRVHPPPTRDRIVLSWPDKAPCSYRFGGLNGSASHIWTTCAFSSVTLMGTSISSRENACDEGIISAAEHVSGHYSHTVWWHS